MRQTHDTLNTRARDGSPRRRPVPSFSAGLAGFVVALTMSGQVLGNEPGARSLDLTLKEGIRLTLKNNRRLVNARLDREVQRFSLRVSENRFLPHATVGPYLERSHTAPGTDATRGGVSTAVTLLVPTGGEFGVRWSLGGGVGGDVPSSERYSNELRLTFRQPLLRGAGIGVNRAPVEIARLTEEINVLALKQTIIGIVSSVIGRYLAYMQAERRVEISVESLRRARELLAVNKELVRTGRMARRDIVQTEADIARRELELIAARNAQDAARLALTDILDIDGGTRIRLTDTLTGVLAPDPARPGVAGSIETALRNRPDYERALLGVRNAETRLRLAGNKRLWDLSVSASMNFVHADEDALEAARRFRNTGYTLSLDLTAPLGPAAVDTREQEYVKAAVDLRKARNDLAELRQRIYIEASNAVREVKLSGRQVESARTVRKLMQEKKEFEREKLRLGLSSNFRLAKFEDDLVAAENTQLDAMIFNLGSLASLDRVLGTTLERWDIEIVDLDRGVPR
ncbi:MAG: TolC family protein [Nitrospinae bacterium]|nr:TolC family protein [Nitrospinota bacterium]